MRFNTDGLKSWFVFIFKTCVKAKSKYNLKKTGQHTVELRTSCFGSRLETEIQANGVAG